LKAVRTFYSENRMDETKRIIFLDTEKRHANLKIRLHYDGLTQADFFKGMMSGYIEKDELLMPFIDKLRQNFSKHGKKRLKDSKKLHRKGLENKDKFALSSSEVENIFDILEEEFPDI